MSSHKWKEIWDLPHFWSFMVFKELLICGFLITTQWGWIGTKASHSYSNIILKWWPVELRMGCQRKQGLATLSGGLSSSDIVLQLLPLNNFWFISAIKLERLLQRNPEICIKMFCSSQNLVQTDQHLDSILKLLSKKRALFLGKWGFRGSY